MNVFGTKIGIQSDSEEEYDTVDNAADSPDPEAIMEDDEVTTNWWWCIFAWHVRN